MSNKVASIHIGKLSKEAKRIKDIITPKAGKPPDTCLYVVTQKQARS